MTSTGCEGPAALTALPSSLSMARTRPYAVPATIVSCTRSVPFCTRTVAIGPLPRSSRASRYPLARGFSGSAADAARRISAQRDCTVSSSFSRLSAQRRNMTPFGGSSSSFKKAFCAARFIVSASGKMYTLPFASFGSTAAVAADAARLCAAALAERCRRHFPRPVPRRRGVAGEDIGMHHLIYHNNSVYHRYFSFDKRLRIEYYGKKQSGTKEG